MEMYVQNGSYYSDVHKEVNPNIDNQIQSCAANQFCLNTIIYNYVLKHIQLKINPNYKDERFNIYKKDLEWVKT